MTEQPHPWVRRLWERLCVQANETAWAIIGEELQVAPGTLGAAVKSMTDAFASLQATIDFVPEAYMPNDVRTHDPFDRED